MRTHTRASTSPCSAHRHVEGEAGIGRIARRLAGIERAPRGAADEAAGAVLARQLRAQDAGADGAVLQRGGIVVELDQLGEAAADVGEEAADAALAGPVEVGRNAAGDDLVHHQAVAEAPVGGPQHALAQDAAMGVEQREGGVVADRADVAEVVGEALQLGHQGAQPDGARWGLDAERGLHGACEGQRVGHRAVARHAPGKPGRALDGRAEHQAVDALVHVAQSLLQPHHGLAVAMEAEMAGLDDAGVHGPDGDLMQRRALGGVEGIGVAHRRRLVVRPERIPEPPAPVVEPAPTVGGTLRLQVVEVGERAFQTQRRRVHPPDRGKAMVGAREA